MNTTVMINNGVDQETRKVVRRWMNMARRLKNRRFKTHNECYNFAWKIAHKMKAKKSKSHKRRSKMSKYIALLIGASWEFNG